MNEKNIQQTVIVNVGNAQKKDSWAGIILWMFLFAPWGVFKLIRRLTN